MSQQVSLSNYEKYLKYRRPEGFEFTTSADKIYVWVLNDNGAYLLTHLVGQDGDRLQLQTADGQVFHVAKDIAEQCKVNPPKFDGVEDCSTLPYLSEASVMHNMQLRYDMDLPYTYSGLFLVALNPYKNIPIYTDEMVDAYRGKRRDEMAPHIFSSSETAYRYMLDEQKSQTMLITGESGAGKTENTKKVIRYLTAVAGQPGQLGLLERQLLQANPLLEAIGNAKTLKNNNSSRFGKFMRITFDRTGIISGASIVSYLLETTRVVAQGPGERSFHIFYQVCAGVAKDDRERLHIGHPSDYLFLRGSGCDSVQGMDDRAEFEQTMVAMRTLGFSDDDVETLIRLVSGILHMGNLEFLPEEPEASRIKDRTPLLLASELLDVPADALEAGLLRPRIKAGRDVVETRVRPEKAANARDSICKALYGRMFMWIVAKINATLHVRPSDLSIGILDIAGFEIFQTNGFEQLCINYTNERLQQFFNNHMFTLEQQEYKRENLSWDMLNFSIDSRPTIELIEKKPNGILPLLDEESVFPSATDTTFVAKVRAAHDGHHPRYRHNPLAQSGLSFSIVHYAGEVEYQADNWLEANKDPLQHDLEAVFKNSGNATVAAFVTMYSADAAMTQMSRPGAAGAPLSRSSRKKGSAFTTVAGAYKEQLQELMDMLDSMHPHFIRCILPNRKQRAGVIEEPIVLEQLRCNGVLEGIRIARKGFPNRMPYSSFVRRYYILVPGIPRKPMDARAASELLLAGLCRQTIPSNETGADESAADVPVVDESRDEYRLGATKIFFRAGVLGRVEEARERMIAVHWVKLQALARAFLARDAISALTSRLAAALLVQRNIRAWSEVRSWPWLQLLRRARPLLRQRDIDSELRQRDERIRALEAASAAAEAAAEAAHAAAAEAADETEELRERSDVKLAQLERELEEEILKVDNLMSEKRELLLAVESARSAALEADGASCELKALLQSQLSASESAMREANAEASAQSEAFARVRASAADLERRLAAAESALAASNERIAGLEQDVMESREALAAANRSRTEASGALRAAESRVAASTSAGEALQHRAEIAEKDISALRSRLIEAEMALTEAREAASSATAQAASLRGELQSAMRTKATAERRIAQLEAALAAESEEREAAEERAAVAASASASVASSAVVEALRKELAAARAAQSELEAAARRQHRDLDAARAAAEEAQSEVRRLQAELEQAAGAAAADWSAREQTLLTARDRARSAAAAADAKAAALAESEAAAQERAAAAELALISVQATCTEEAERAATAESAVETLRQALQRARTEAAAAGSAAALERNRALVAEQNAAALAADLEATAAHLASDGERLSAALTAAQATATSRAEVLAETEGRVRTLAARAEAAERRLAAISTSAQRVEELEAALAAAERAAVDAGSAATADRARSAREVSQLEARLASTERTMAATESRLAELLGATERAQSLHSELAASREAQAAAAMAADAAKVAAAAAERAAAAAESRAAALAARLAAAERAAADASAEAEALSAALQSQLQTSADSSLAAAEARAAAAAARARVPELESAIAAAVVRQDQAIETAKAATEAAAAADRLRSAADSRAELAAEEARRSAAAATTEAESARAEAERMRSAAETAQHRLAAVTEALAAAEKRASEALVAGQQRAAEAALAEQRAAAAESSVALVSREAADRVRRDERALNEALEAAARESAAAAEAREAFAQADAQTQSLTRDLEALRPRLGAALAAAAAAEAERDAATEARDRAKHQIAAAEADAARAIADAAAEAAAAVAARDSAAAEVARARATRAQLLATQRHLAEADARRESEAAERAKAQERVARMEEALREERNRSAAQRRELDKIREVIRRLGGGGSSSPE